MTRAFDRWEAIPIRTRGLILLGALTLLLVGMAGHQHFRRMTGQEIVLAAHPVDPRDLLRGAYVTLAYDAEQVPLARLTPEQRADLRGLHRGDTLYVTLPKTKDVTAITALSRRKPARDPNTIMLRAKLDQNIAPDRLSGDDLTGDIFLDFGADRYFADEAGAKALEDANREGALKVVLSVGGDGKGVIKALIVNGRRRDESFF